MNKSTLSSCEVVPETNRASPSNDSQKYYLVLCKDNSRRIFYAGRNAWNSLGKVKKSFQGIPKVENYEFYHVEKDMFIEFVIKRYPELASIPSHMIPLSSKTGRVSVDKLLNSCKNIPKHSQKQKKKPVNGKVCADVKKEAEKLSKELLMRKNSSSESICSNKDKKDATGIYSYKGVFAFAIVGSFQKVSSIFDRTKFNSLKNEDGIVSLENAIKEIAVKFDKPAILKYYEKEHTSEKVKLPTGSNIYKVLLNDNNQPKDCIIRRYPNQLSQKTKSNDEYDNHFILFDEHWKAKIFSAATHEKESVFLRKANSLEWRKQTKDGLLEKIFSEPMFHEQNEIKIINRSEEKSFLEQMEKFKEALNDENEVYHIYVDGSCNRSRKMYSWAFVVYLNNQEIFFDKGHEEQPHLIAQGSQVGEFLAMCHAVDYILENNLKNVVVWYDNTQNFNCMDSFNTNNKSDIFAKYFIYMQKKKLVLQANNINVRYEHSKAHSGIIGNERADKLAKRAIEEVNSIF